MVNSSRRRPPGPTGGVTTKYLLAWTLAFFATTAQSKIDYVQPSQVYQSATTRIASAEPRRSQAGRSPAEIPLLKHDTPTAKFRNTDNGNVNIERYQYALAPAHDESAVRAPSVQSLESSPGFSALPPARLLQDWEADDIVILSTIDGALHARDRKDGTHRWSLEMPDAPMIEAIHYPTNRSELDEVSAREEYMFVVEPSKDGQLYAQFANPRIGLVRLQATVRKMATEVPFTMHVNGQYLAISSEQQSKPYAIDAATGEILYQSSKGRASSRSDTQPRCPRRNDLEVEDPACKPGRIIRLGRNQYTFTISDEHSGQDLCTIKFSEWVTNKGDSDLQQQYTRPLDDSKVQGRYHGGVIGLDTKAESVRNVVYSYMLSAPVARVFDVVRSLDDSPEATDLALLSRPMDLPLSSDAQVWQQESQFSQRVFVNKTSRGQWYAMSELSYPGVTLGAPLASINWRPSEHFLDLDGDLHDIVGVHELSQGTGAAPIPLTISDSPANDDDAVDQSHQVAPLEIPQVPSLTQSGGVDWLSTIITVIFSGILFFFAGRKWGALGPKIGTLMFSKQPVPQYTQATQQVVTQVEMPSEEPSIDINPTSVTTEIVPKAELNTPVHSRAQSSASATPSPTKKPVKSSDQEESGSEADSDNDDPSQDGVNTQAEDARPRKKQTKRGKRGGRKNKKKAMDPATFDSKPVLAVEQHLDDGAVQVGSLKIDAREETCLGHGSNGTTVYPGVFKGREVAVKRLIKSTNDLAKKEIQHLMSSDENSHIVRYVTQEESRDFFYIALDKYVTSLDQFIEHPERFPTLRSANLDFDVKDCLRQITDGVKHLHSLKLVHRDIKPQNVLVKAIKSERPGLPKLHFVISDFGLCKPLEEGPMSTFAPTVNHTAAGTTGWRAPELLVSPRDTVAAPNANTTSTASRSTTHSIDGTVVDRPSGRRATKAIDIFSLGCVFYYVMTQGGHPFDKGGESLGRDLNIKEDNFTTELLRLHNYEFDADDLVLQMLKHDPKQRPDCDGVLSHPYFWDLSTKLQFVCSVSNGYEGIKNSISNIHNDNVVRSVDEVAALQELNALESLALNVIGTKNSDGSIRDFLNALPKSFLNEMGKQRKYTGTRMIDLLRVIRNKWNHFEDLPMELQDQLFASSAEGYYGFWSSKFPSLLINCHCLILERGLVERFKMGKWY